MENTDTPACEAVNASNTGSEADSAPEHPLAEASGREKSYLNLLDSSPDAIVIYDMEGRVTYLNPSHTKLFGWTPEEALGKRLDTLPEWDREATIAIIKGIIENGRPYSDYETQRLTKDGALIDVNVSASSFLDEDGNPDGMLVIIRDVSDKKRAEQALRRSEAGYRLLVENISTAVAVIRDDRINYVNPRFCRLTGYDEEDLLESTLECLEPREQSMERPDTACLVPGRAPQSEDFELNITRKDGSTACVLARTVNTNWTGGAATMVFLTDITDRRKAEEGLRTSLREKEILLRELHHRVKNNLQAVMSLLGLHAMRGAEVDCTTLLTDLQNRVKSMAMVHENLHQSDNLAGIRLSDYVESLAENLIQSYAYDPNSVILETDLGSITLGVDTAVPMGFIITELLSNCFKHAFPRGRAGRIRVSMKLTSDTYQLIVWDDGVGMPSHLDVNCIQSLGLGLVTAFVEQLNGSIEYGVDNGTQVRIVFPASQTT